MICLLSLFWYIDFLFIFLLKFSFLKMCLQLIENFRLFSVGIFFYGLGFADCIYLHGAIKYVLLSSVLYIRELAIKAWSDSGNFVVVVYVYVCVLPYSWRFVLWSLRGYKMFSFVMLSVITNYCFDSLIYWGLQNGDILNFNIPFSCISWNTSKKRIPSFGYPEV